MNRPKTGKPTGRDEPIEDPALLQAALRSLQDSATEFSIKVEGTSTLPYASEIQMIELERKEIILKLVRPLPHELLGGAIFRMVFAVDEQRFEALITYVQREAYLQYRFSQPEHLFFADRRRAKRFPFRPRESAYVIASDGGIPGLGVAGPLVNISLGGLCLRVDRVLKLDDGIRIPASTALFERGASFPRLRVQDLPRLPLLELSGWVSHASDRGSEILLGMDFGELAEEHARLLGDSLALREKMFQSRSGPAPSDSGNLTRDESGGTSDRSQDLLGQPTGETEPSGAWPEPLRLLLRKGVRLVLIGAKSPLVARCLRGLWQSGYHRLEVAPSCQEARACWQDAVPPSLVLVDLSLGGGEGQEPLAAVRRLDRELVILGDVPVVILCENIDPTMFLGRESGTRFLSCREDPGDWVPALDELLNLGV